MITDKFILAAESDLRTLIRDEVERAVEGSFNAFEKLHDPAPNERFSQRKISQRHGISEPTLIKWRKEGKVDFQEVNGRIYYTDRNIEEAFQRSKRFRNPVTN